MKIPFINEEKSSGELYCGILLKENQGACYLYEKKPSSVLLIKQKEFQYSDGWEHIVDDIDEALSIIEHDMGKQSMISQCVFFVYAHLIDQATHEIIKPYITKLKEVSNSLELKPVGYMEVIDAVHEELENEKQTRLSSIVVELDDTKMTTFLFKGGHKLIVQQGSRTDNFTEDMQGALEKIAQNHILPNHIYLYDSTDLATESSDLLLYAWKKNLFIQQPRITVVSASTVNKALLNLLEKQLCEKPQVIEPTEKESQAKEVMGFVIGGEVVDEDSVQENREEKKATFSFPTFKIPPLPFSRAIPLIVIPLLVVCLCMGLLYFLHSAQITIKVPLEQKDAQVTILASKNPTKTEQVELQTFSTPFSMNEKKDTTGKRDIGEKATGEITLYSYDEKEKQLPKGTKLQFDALSYETDDSITIPASQFASDSITKNPGKAKIKVHASNLGTESNIEKNKRFSVSGISSNVVFGINESAMTGGTKKTVRTISKSDMDNLESFVLEKAKSEILKKQKVDERYLLLPDLATTQVKKGEFSGEVGEEADSLRYSVTGEVVQSRIPREAILGFVEKKLENEKPEGYETKTVNFSVKKQKKLESGDMQLTIGGEIQFSMVLSARDISQAVVGKGKEEGESLIKNQFKVSQVETAIRPAIPLLQDRMPFWMDHIRVDLMR